MGAGHWTHAAGAAAGAAAVAAGSAAAAAAAGGVAATPKLLDKLCKQMVEKNLDDSIEFAIYNLDKFIQPISDLRGSSFYRLEAMKGLFKRLQICLKQDKESLSIMEV